MAAYFQTSCATVAAGPDLPMSPSDTSGYPNLRTLLQRFRGAACIAMTRVARFGLKMSIWPFQIVESLHNFFIGAN